jgi:rare lipoprotein A
MTRRVLILGVCAPVLAACGVKVRPSTSATGPVQRGLAGFYGHGDGYDGRLTASGQRFDKNAMTAAHFDLPFGTRIRVRNLKNGREADLTVTDRFPKATLNKGRILDVSYGAARKLQMVEDGVVPIELTVRA